MVSYLDMAKQAGHPPVFPLPDLDPEEYMHALLMEIGPVRSNGMGLAATDWPVVSAFARVKGLDDHDTSTLAAMCRAHFEEFQAGESPLRIPPMNRED